jgi:hypothetical protein
MEFEPAFRWIDVTEEIAFLVADLDAQDFRSAGHAFLCGYLAESGDYEGVRLLNLYKTHRALVRAKVSALSASEAKAGSQEREQATRLFRGYLRTASESLGSMRPRLILMSGLSGSGKTWLAQRLAPMLNAAHIRSDLERKRQAGLAPTSRSGYGPEQGLYSRATTEQVYERLAGAAAHVLAGGYTAIVDATFNRRAERERLRRLAASYGVQLQLVRCQAPEATLRQRIEERAARGNDASDADLSVLQWQQQHAEPIDPGEEIDVLDVQSTQETRPSIDELARLLGAPR